jgi:nitroreductase
VDGFLLIVSKREVREYADRPLPEVVVHRILEAGRIAGSSANKQARRFVVVETPELVERLAETVYISNTVLGAKLVVAIALTEGGTGFDAGRAAQNMMFAAWNDGVGSCPNGMKDRSTAAELLELREGEEPAIVLTFGYPATERDPERRSPEEWIGRANRKPFDEAVTRL